MGRFRLRRRRLQDRCFARIRSVHYATSTESPVQDVVIPGRRPLGAQTAELAAVVQDRKRLGGSVVQGETLKVQWEPTSSGLPFLLVTF